MWRTMDVKIAVKELEEWIGEDEEELMMVGDIKNMYTELPHREIMKAIGWLLDRVKETIRGSEWVRVKKRGKGGGMFGKGGSRKEYVMMQMKDIERVVEFDIENCYIWLGRVVVRQVGHSNGESNESGTGNPDLHNVRGGIQGEFRERYEN